MCRGSIGHRLLGFVPSIQSLRIAVCGIQLCAYYLCSVHLPTFRRVQGYMGPNSSSNNYLGSRYNGLITDRKTHKPEVTYTLPRYLTIPVKASFLGLKKLPASRASGRPSTNQLSEMRFSEAAPPPYTFC